MSKAYLEASDVAALEKASTNLRDRLLIKLLFHLGCRVTEALSLMVEDIDFSTATIRILHLKSRLQLNCTACGAGLGRSHVYCPRCGINVKEAVTKQQEHRKVRTLPIDKETLEILRDYIKRGGLVKRGDKALIFGISRHRAWQIVKECAEKAGLPKLINPETGKMHNISPHKLRDAFATHAVELNDSGDGLRLLQEHLGHVSFNTTAKYRKVAGEELKDWYQKLWQQNDTNTDNGKKN